MFGWRFALFLIVWSFSTVAIAAFGMGAGFRVPFGLAALVGLLPPLAGLRRADLVRRRREAAIWVAAPAGAGVAPTFGPGMNKVLTGAGAFSARAAQPRAGLARQRVLVCAFEPRFGSLVDADADRYGRVCPATRRAIFTSRAEFLTALADGVDVVHLLGEAGEGGTLANLGLGGETLIAECAAAGVALLWIASDNVPQVYLDGFRPRGRPMNLILTLQRHGPLFGDFLERLLSRMAAGETLGQAWVRLCPQGTPGPQEPDAPGALFVMGLPQWPPS